MKPLQFRFRDLLWLMLAAALAAGWWVNHRRQLAEAIKLAEQLQAEQRKLKVRDLVRRLEELVPKMHSGYHPIELRPAPAEGAWTLEIYPNVVDEAELESSG